MSRVKIGRRIYLTADRKRAVEEGDPDARFLLCTAGGEVALADAKRYGLLDEPEEAPDEAPEEAPESDAEQQDAPVKAARRPPNKARRAAANKSAGKDAGES